MKKILGLLLMMGLMVVGFGGCGGDGDSPTRPSEEVAIGPQGQTLEVSEQEIKIYTNKGGQQVTKEKYDKLLSFQKGEIKEHRVEFQFYRDGDRKVLHGYYRKYDEGGNIIIDRQYKEGERWSGEFSYDVEDRDDHDGVFGEEDFFVETGKEIGDTTTVFSGNFIYSEGKKEGEVVLRNYLNGEVYIEGNYTAGKRDGKWLQYYLDGEIQYETNYKDGNYDGKTVEYYPYIGDGRVNGNGRKRFEDNYNNGNKEGKSFWYTPGGNIVREGNYKDGNEDGRWVSYYTSGELEQEGNYLSGMIEGKWTLYYENGDVAGEWNFVDGKLSGKSVWYAINGDIEDEDIYENGECVDMCEGACEGVAFCEWTPPLWRIP